ncbi:tripartite tricarboxylate transporter substrate binding protein [Curvibacter sp. HBC61]|uniref:Tripartite tricarboxylate transporter substrate binding protein n=1 Tax=Curvibacter cyanobacteriorum TaxID=3026422 RepID=A0ABT5N064_9BURK|nr:tripartite tricarboxylate transporter substrate binding protein [Curvibacter sp. HBC61]MDD0838432.1 tripartite tricarboxylate transporter substrate binding protein [Curvibacter sp. HBC61]
MPPRLPFTRRQCLGLGATLLAPTWAQAQSANYPERPVKLMVGYPAGGAVDVVARTVGQALTGPLGQSVVVENKPGAGSNIAIKSVIDSPADGYTLMVAANALAANMSLYQPAPFDAERDLAPIGLIGRVPVVLAVNPASGFSSLAQLITAAKSKPHSVQYATPGNGSTPHLAVELFERAAGLQLTHVPYRGGGPAITDVIGGQLPLVAVNALEALPHQKSGRLRVIAVLSARRSPIFPDVPTIAESGFPGFEASVWYGLLAPAATPKPIISRLHTELQKALASKDVRDKLAAVGGEVTPGSSEDFARLIRSEHQRYEKAIRSGNITPD